MAYDVKYIGDKEVIKSYLDNRGDRIESEFELKAYKDYVDHKFNNLFGNNNVIKTIKIDETTNVNGTVIGLRGVSKQNVSMISVAGIGLNATQDYTGVSVYPRWNVNESRVELFFTKNDKPLANTRVIVWLAVIEFN